MASDRAGENRVEIPLPAKGEKIDVNRTTGGLDKIPMLVYNVSGAEVSLFLRPVYLSVMETALGRGDAR